MTDDDDSRTEEQEVRKARSEKGKIILEPFTDFVTGIPSNPVILGIPVAGSWTSRTKRDLPVRPRVIR